MINRKSRFMLNTLIKNLVSSALLLTSLTAMHFTFAQQPLMIDVSSCVILESILERYECYEKQVESNESTPVVRNQISMPPVREISNPVVTSSMTSSTNQNAQRVSDAESNFGLPEEQIEDQEASELVSTIAEVREFAPNYLSITLDNGQVWRQTVGKSYRLRSGHEVRIYSTGWGDSFRLAVTNLGSYIQVERVK